MSRREKFFGMVTALLVGSAFFGCARPSKDDPGVHAVQSRIVGGTETSGDPSVVLIFAYGPNSGSSCTGEVIAPRVVMTAGHCVHPDEVGEGANFVVYNGPDMAKARYSEYYRAAKGIPHPLFDPNDVGTGHDVGLLIFDDDLPFDLLPWNKAPLTNDMIGQPIRFVGYGIISGDPQDQNTSGVKRETTTVLSDFDDLLLEFDDTVHNTCSGDSGGPAFLKIGGVETIIGVTSYGLVSQDGIDCELGGYDTRIDALKDWIQPQIDATGYVAPDTRPHLALGDACTAHLDCASGICANDVKTNAGYCTQPCDPTLKTADPAGYYCAAVASTNLLVKGKAPSKGCAMGGTPEQSAFALLLVAAALHARRRHTL